MKDAGHGRASLARSDMVKDGERPGTEHRNHTFVTIFVPKGM